MWDRPTGHVGLCVALVASGCYVYTSWNYALWTGAPTDDVTAHPWLVALAGLVVLTAALGVAAGIQLWRRAPTGRRLGFAFVLSWALTEALAIWGWLGGPAIARPVVGDPMAPPFRLWVALSIGLYLWGWAGAYVDRPDSAGTDS